MPGYEDAGTAAADKMWADNKAWTESIPNKIGLFHCFMRSNAQAAREHKVYILVSGEDKHVIACKSNRIP
jgi:hypothetical protein